MTKVIWTLCRECYLYNSFNQGMDWFELLEYSRSNILCLLPSGPVFNPGSMLDGSFVLAASAIHLITVDHACL